MTQNIEQKMQKNGIVWKVTTGECQLCGRPGVGISIRFVDTGNEIFITNLNEHKDAIDFISDIKKAGIIIV